MHADGSRVTVPSKRTGCCVVVSARLLHSAHFSIFPLFPRVLFVSHAGLGDNHGVHIFLFVWCTLFVLRLTFVVVILTDLFLFLLCLD